MIDVNFFLQLLSLASISPVIVLSLLFYSRYKRNTVLFYALFMFGLFCFIMNSLLLLSFEMRDSTDLSPFLTAVIYFFGSVGELAFFFAGPVLVHSLFDLQTKRIAAGAGALALFSVLGSRLFTHFSMMIFWYLAITVSLYMMVICLWKMRSIKDPLLRNSIIIFLSISGVNVVLLAFRLFDIPHFYLISELGVSVYLIIINILNTLFSIKFFSRENRFIASGVPDPFISQYKISPRETEMTKLLLKGHSAKSASDILFIAQKTAYNHIHNIYRKTGVKNRIQLIHLVSKFL